VIFIVGNIPYDATEEQLVEIFKEVGNIISFRLVPDKDTGKPKGYGFCEYVDSDTALSAIRNLSGREFNGRSLKVDFAENENLKQANATGPNNPIQPTPTTLPNQPNPANWPVHSTVPNMNVPMHMNNNNPPNPNPTVPVVGGVQSEINKVIDSMSHQQLYEVMVQMKGLIQTYPEQARQMLISSPQLAYALLQTQVVLGMINPQMAKTIIECSTSNNATTSNLCSTCGKSTFFPWEPC